MIPGFVPPQQPRSYHPSVKNIFQNPQKPVRIKLTSLGPRFIGHRKANTTTADLAKETLQNSHSFSQSDESLASKKICTQSSSDDEVVECSDRVQKTIQNENLLPVSTEKVLVIPETADKDSREEKKMDESDDFLSPSQVSSSNSSSPLTQDEQVVQSLVPLSSPSPPTTLQATSLSSWLDEEENLLLPKLDDHSLSLEEGTGKLAQLEDLARQANKAESADGQNERLQKLIQRLRGEVDAKNKDSTTLTVRDVQMLSSFFSPPVETHYIDPIDQKKYFLADNSQLMRLGTEYLLRYGCYIGIEVSKLYRVNEPPLKPNKQEKFSHRCDVIFFKKSHAQISRETSTWRSLLLPSISSTVTQQEELHDALFAEVCRKYKDWGYQGVYLAVNSEEMEEMGIIASSDYHGIFLFLKTYSDK